MYKVISCGVNNGLSFAEKDAHDIATFFRSSLGPPVDDESVILLQGCEAKAENIEGEIRKAGLSPTEYLVLFFAGHGSRTGVSVAKGELSYDRIISALIQARIPYTILQAT